MKKLGALAVWLAKAMPGRCPCGRKVSRKGARLCVRPECRERYLDLWRAEKRGVSDRSKVAGKTRSPAGGGLVRIRYHCRDASGKVIRTHFEDMVPSLAARVGSQRCCPMCAGR